MAVIISKRRSGRAGTHARTRTGPRDHGMIVGKAIVIVAGAEVTTGTTSGGAVVAAGAAVVPGMIGAARNSIQRLSSSRRAHLISSR